MFLTPHASAPEGELPVANGKPLDLGFESGTLENWTVEGDAFAVVSGQAASGTGASVSGRAGSYSVSSMAGGNSRRGTLSSTPFRVSAALREFPDRGRCLRKHARGAGHRRRQQSRSTRSPARTTTCSGRRLSICLATSDATSSCAWWTTRRGRRPRCISRRARGPTSTSTTSGSTRRSRTFRTRSPRPRRRRLPPMDPVPHAGLSPKEAAAAMTVPKGFTVKLAAAEPDVVRPIAFTLDDRGRLWVVEGHTYPLRAPEGQGQDRILILEDTNGDGRLDSRKVFIENLNLVSGIEVGFGGVWVGASPYLLFIPIKDGTDRPGGTSAGDARRLRATKTRTRRSTRSPGDRMDGSTERTAYSLIRTSASRGRLSLSGRSSMRACGGSTRRSTRSRCSPRAPAIRGAWRSTTTATPSSRPA